MNHILWDYPDTPTHLTDAKADCTVKFDEKHVSKIKQGWKTLTARYDFDKPLYVGSAVDFATPDGDVFATIEVKDRWEITIEEFVSNRYSGHVRYDSVEDCIQSFKQYYPDADLTAETTLTAFSWEKIAYNGSAMVVESEQAEAYGEIEFVEDGDDAIKMDERRGISPHVASGICGVCGQSSVVDRVTRRRKYMGVRWLRCAYCGTAGSVRYRYQQSEEGRRTVRSVFSAWNRCIESESKIVKVSSENVPRCNRQFVINTEKRRFIEMGEDRPGCLFGDISHASHKVNPLE